MDLVLVMCVRVTYAKSMILWPEIPVIPVSSSTTCSAHEPNTQESFKIVKFEASNRYLNTLHSWLTESWCRFRSCSVPFPMLRYDEWRRPQQWLQLPEAWNPPSPTQTWLCYKHKISFIFPQAMAGSTAKRCDVYLRMSNGLIEGEVCNSCTTKQQIY